MGTFDITDDTLVLLAHRRTPNDTEYQRLLREERRKARRVVWAQACDPRDPMLLLNVLRLGVS